MQNKQVSVTINKASLERLLTQQQLTINEFHCIGRDTKQWVRRVLLVITAHKLRKPPR
ncbi:hypothetical protein [Teredinibacter haidensis]|uniref:hypothetical protein n=1 Tax=Teredinibacter haidensis TaxID=2731755 RepID=UPI000A46EEC6|nr:hypothetical protein [Teredinibacter haidensis]